jgi:hypothetical protein
VKDCQEGRRNDGTVPGATGGIDEGGALDATVAP